MRTLVVNEEINSLAFWNKLRARFNLDDNGKPIDPKAPEELRQLVVPVCTAEGNPAPMPKEITVEDDRADDIIRYCSKIDGWKLSGKYQNFPPEMRVALVDEETYRDYKPSGAASFRKRV